MYTLDNTRDPSATGVGVNYLDMCDRSARATARLGGDKFVIVAPRITSTGLAHLAERITTALYASKRHRKAST